MVLSAPLQKKNHTRRSNTTMGNGLYGIKYAFKHLNFLPNLPTPKLDTLSELEEISKLQKRARSSTSNTSSMDILSNLTLETSCQWVS